MDLRKTLALALALIAVAYCTLPATAFIGAGFSLDKHLGKTVDFHLTPLMAQAAGSAYGLAAMDLGVSWGVDYDINSLAGYPYGYGGVGAITDANLGYSLGLSLDEVHGAGFDGSPFGIPYTEGSQTATRYNNLIAAQEHLQDVQVALPF